ncbi:protein MEI2-like 6 [Papaver somniferum]|uniref:protein MEI2-like 6 n=1 Tax=Papaver somniferum TaxID=3469 RepID=UPI000E702478|nr:protein MEI2-like 6 [Papaver somniferum]
MATYLNPAAEIFIPYQNYFVPPSYHHHHLQVNPTSSYSSYPPLPLPYYKTYSAPPTTTTTTSSLPSCPAITPVFSTSTATCHPPPPTTTSSNYYQYSSLSPDWYGKVEKNVVLEENLKNPDDTPKKGRVGMGKIKMYIPPRLGGSYHHQPASVRTRCNKGYAFVNMINSSGAAKLKLFLTDHKWGVYQSKKICKISPANIQGKEALVKRFENCYFMCDSDKLLPLFFSPYRDGSGGFVVGPPFYQNEADGGLKLTAE